MDLIEKYLGEAKEYTDNDWVVVANRKVVKYVKNPKSDKAPNSAFTASNQEIIRVSKAKQMGIIKEAMGFVQKLPYQLKKGGKKKLSADDIALLKARGGSGKITTTRGDGNSITPNRPEPVNKKTSKVKKVLMKNDNAPVKVGDIFYNSWGYDQTNIDWYQVVAVSPTGKTCKIRQIRGNVKDAGFMSGITVPVPGKWHERNSKVLQKKIRISGGEVNLPMTHGWCPKWDGKPKHSSWGH